MMVRSVYNNRPVLQSGRRTEGECCCCPDCCPCGIVPSELIFSWAWSGCYNSDIVGGVTIDPVSVSLAESGENYAIYESEEIERTTGTPPMLGLLYYDPSGCTIDWDVWHCSTSFYLWFYVILSYHCFPIDGQGTMAWGATIQLELIGTCFESGGFYLVGNQCHCFGDEPPYEDFIPVPCGNWEFGASCSHEWDEDPPDDCTLCNQSCVEIVEVNKP